MKKILIVEVPEGYEIKPFNVTAHNMETYERLVCMFTEFTPPTDDEIITEVFKRYPEDIKMRMAFKLGLVWFKSLLL